MFDSLIRFSAKRPIWIIAFWFALFCGAVPFALKVPSVLQGSTDPITNSESNLAGLKLEGYFGKGALHAFPLLVRSSSCSVRDTCFLEEILQIEAALKQVPRVVGLQHAWNSGELGLLGRDGHSAILMVRVTGSFSEIESVGEGIRQALRQMQKKNGFTFELTGTTVAMQDINRESSKDLLKAERIGVPLTLLILLIVFGAPLAAALPLILAMLSLTLAQAILYAFNRQVPIGVFSLNVVSMIGLGVGVDYALFVVSGYRRALEEGWNRAEAAAIAGSMASHTVLFSGASVSVGFLALLMVKAKFLWSLALGGCSVCLVAVLACLSLLPACLALLPEAWVNWPRNLDLGRNLRQKVKGFWGNFAAKVMRHPFAFLLAACLVLAVLAAPARKIKSWNMGALDLPQGSEARQGAQELEKNFEKGWSGPLLVLLETKGTGNLWDAGRQAAVLSLATDLSGDSRVAKVMGYNQILAGAVLQKQGGAGLSEAVRKVVSVDGRAALLLVLPHGAPEDPQTIALVKDIRLRLRALDRSGISAQVTGASAFFLDFEHGFFSGLWRVIPMVLGATFIMLCVLFRSLLIPLKATAMNLVAVLAAYGFLVYVFQFGLGTGWIGLNPPGGLNPFIVLMLFTILFGLSMDYELFLLTRIRDEHASGKSNAAAVTAGLEGTGGLISSAALIMVCLFASFGFSGLTATREFGLGLAFAVALDATIIRLILVPALMELFGEMNWWLPKIFSRKLGKELTHV